jgi:hypothetical protein
VAKARDAIDRGVPTDVFSIWREHMGAEDVFELTTASFHEE